MFRDFKDNMKKALEIVTDKIQQSDYANNDIFFNTPKYMTYAWSWMEIYTNC